MNTWNWLVEVAKSIKYLTLILLPGAVFGTWHDFVSLITQKWSYLPFPTPSRFGHMCILYNPDPKKISKFVKCLSYKGCDEMIKKG